jgi:hypothetical protein
MTFDLAKILQSKRDFRQRAATRPVEEKLAMLDALRERDLTLRSAQSELPCKHKEPPDQQVSANKSE